MRDFRELEVWRRAHNFVISIYKITNEFPKHESYNIVSQIRRSSVSIPANIAEGTSQRTNKGLARYLRISLGSATEVEYYLILSEELGYISNDLRKDLNNEIVIIRKMLNRFIGKLN